MKTNRKGAATSDTVEQLAGLFEQTQEQLQRHVARSVDSALVARNWLFGWYIEEFERGGASRAEVYGKGLMKELSARLAARGLHGCSVPNLNRFRQFYRAHSEIRSTLSSESFGPAEIAPTPSAQSLVTFVRHPTSSSLSTSSTTLPISSTGLTHHVGARFIAPSVPTSARALP